MSDHRHIIFDIDGSGKNEQIQIRNPRETNWEQYRSHLKEYLEQIPKYIKSPQSLNEATRLLNEKIQMAYEQSCPLRDSKPSNTTKWWNKRLEKLRVSTRSQFNQCTTPEKWKQYGKALTEYNKEIRKARRASWRRFCEEITKTHQGARLHKILAKTPENYLGLLKKPDNTFTTTEAETLELLRVTHFPGSYQIIQTEVGMWAQENSLHRAQSIDWNRANAIFRPNQVKWALNKFKPFKSAGEDGIFPALLQQGIDNLLPHLVKIFRASFAWTTIPEPWTRVKVRFIPKTGKKDYSQPKSFRPISLTSFLLKTMERIIDQHIRANCLVRNPLNGKQYAYQKGKSTETALLDLVDKIAESVEIKQTALCAFLDVEGAFDNTPTRTIIKGLGTKGVDSTTIGWIQNMLSKRVASVTLNATKQSFRTTRGCPQGGVLSPLMWTIAVDQLLAILAEKDYDIQGYADDLVVIVRGPCLSTISNLLQGALNIINNWCRDNELSINADKTVIVPFTRKRKLERLVQPEINGKLVSFSAETKYLGVIIDQKLTWNPHLENIIQKARIAMWTTCRMAGNRWGLKPYIALWLYKAVVRPIITYASAVWGNKSYQKTVQNKLDSLQRLACITATGAMSTTPGAALNALLNLMPLHLYVQKEAKQCMYRQNIQTKAKWSSRILSQFNESVLDNELLGMPSDETITECSFTKWFSVTIPSRDEWMTKQMCFRKGSHIWYTDGSKKGNNVGCGIYGERPRHKTNINMGSMATIFQAEVFAINKCAEINLERKLRNQHIYINSDSQAALMALESFEINSKLVQQCNTNLNALGKDNHVTLQWVPGHCNIDGNELADDLAKKGADNRQVGLEPFCGITKRQVYTLLNQQSNLEAKEIWQSVTNQTHSKACIEGYNTKVSESLLQLNRYKTCAVTRILTGHAKLKKHMKNMGLGQEAECRFCNEAEETAMHILCECGPLMLKRSIYLGRQTVRPDEIQQITPRNIWKFLEETGISSEL